MKKLFLFFLIFVVLSPFNIAEAQTKKSRKVFLRKWSLSLVNGYSFYSLKKSNIKKPFSLTDWEDGQTQEFFSALELARNFGLFEIGAKIQNTKQTFISPFLKLNSSKNYSNKNILGSLTFGFTPSILMGAWLRASLSLSVNKYLSLEPFMSIYAWHKIKEHPEYADQNLHLNTGLKINLYY
ncbi:MAG: hypothetical protein OXC37_04045 [Bdellovibrionaceae bacterium]|nr:hypothetical protein [Pseudobdellovibrionaceae bacterium]